MSFLYPLGLLGLIGVPIIIIIYLIKNKYTEQIIPTTYLWTLSERFLKKKKPISPISGIISLILQIIAITTISLIIAHPVITIPNSAKEYCFILDGSGSMQMESSNGTRLDAGKEEIKNLIESSIDGSKYTLIYVSSNTRVIYEKLPDKNKACEMLSELEPTGISVSYTDSLTYIQEYFNEYNSLETYLITDKDYKSNNIEVINVSNNEENYAIVDCNYNINNGKLVINGDVISYENNGAINLSLYVDGVLEEDVTIETEKLNKSSFEFESPTINFKSINVVINNKDGLMTDNQKIIYNVEKEHEYSILVVSKNPFYIVSALQKIGKASIAHINPESYHNELTGYSLYIFDSYVPDDLPKDGSIWLFGANKSIEEAGFSVRDEVTMEDLELPNGIKLTYAKNSTSEFKELTEGLLKETISISKYQKYGLYKNFTTILMHNGNPILFTGNTKSGNREVVFAFDLHDSNFPLMSDYLTLVENLINYSFPMIIEESSFICGEEVKVNIVSGASSVRVETPTGKISYLSTNNTTSTFVANEAGTYTITVMIGEEEKVFSIYASLPESESSSIYEIEEISLVGEKGNSYSDGIYNKLIIFFIILAIIYMADWMVYCYEQYQLR